MDAGINNDNVTAFLNEIADKGFPESNLSLQNKIEDLTSNKQLSKLMLLKNDVCYKIEEYNLLAEIEPDNADVDPYKTKGIFTIFGAIERLNNLSKIIDNIIDNETNKGGKKAQLPPQETETSKKPELLENEITHPKRSEIAIAVKQKYNSYKNKDFKILYEAFLMLDLFPKKGKRMTFFRCLKNEGYNIKNHQMLEDKHFKNGGITKKGNYTPSEDEKQRDTIIEYLKTIIETK